MGFVLWCQAGHRLEFNYYFFPNQQIGEEFAHESAAKMYVNRHLRPYRQPTFPKRNCKSIFVHRFQKSGPKLVADIKSASYYAFGKIRVEKTIISFILFILFIHVNFPAHWKMRSVSSTNGGRSASIQGTMSRRTSTGISWPMLYSL